MKCVVQRVSEASVTIKEEKVSEIKKGLFVLVGIEPTDTQEDIDWLVAKIVKMRIFEDQQHVMNLSVQDIDGEVLIVSQFTLQASTKKGNRPSYINAAKPDIAIPLYQSYTRQFEKEFGKPLKTGVFGADMKVGLINDGPVTIIIDSKNRV